MKLDQNLGAVEAKTVGAFLPEGVFECKVKEVRWGRSAQKGTLYLELVWECIDGDLKGSTARERKFLTDGTLPYFKGWSQSVMNVTLNSNSINEALYVNRVAQIKIVKFTPEGYDKERTDVNSFKTTNLKWFEAYNKPVDGSQGAKNETPNSIKPDDSNGGNSGGGNSGHDEFRQSYQPPSDYDLPF